MCRHVSTLLDHVERAEGCGSAFALTVKDLLCCILHCTDAKLSQIRSCGRLAEFCPALSEVVVASAYER
jgi:hypothetical protein